MNCRNAFNDGGREPPITCLCFKCDSPLIHQRSLFPEAGTKLIRKVPCQQVYFPLDGCTHRGLGSETDSLIELPRGRGGVRPAQSNLMALKRPYGAVGRLIPTLMGSRGQLQLNSYQSDIHHCHRGHSLKAAGVLWTGQRWWAAHEAGNKKRGRPLSPPQTTH